MFSDLKQLLILAVVAIIGAIGSMVGIIFKSYVIGGPCGIALGVAGKLLWDAFRESKAQSQSVLAMPVIPNMPNVPGVPMVANSASGDPTQSFNEADLMRLAIQLMGQAGMMEPDKSIIPLTADGKAVVKVVDNDDVLHLSFSDNTPTEEAVKGIREQVAKETKAKCDNISVLMQEAEVEEQKQVERTPDLIAEEFKANRVALVAAMQKTEAETRKRLEASMHVSDDIMQMRVDGNEKETLCAWCEQPIRPEDDVAVAENTGEWIHEHCPPIVRSEPGTPPPSRPAPPNVQSPLSELFNPAGSLVGSVPKSVHLKSGKA